MKSLKKMKLTDRQKFIGLSLIALLFVFGITISSVQNRQNQSASAQLENNSSSKAKVARSGSSTQGRNGKVNIRTASDFKLAATEPISPLPPTNETPEQMKARINPTNLPLEEPIPPLTNEDIVNYLLGGTESGRKTASDFNSTIYMIPGSRMYTSTDNVYDAAVAHIYYWQFKAHVAYADIVFNLEVGDDLQFIANNIATGSAYVMKSREGDALVRVASIYRGDLCTSSVYDNPRMKEILLSWGRDDLAAEPGVGETDIESIALVAQAMDEQPDPVLRRDWFLSLYSFDDNNNPMSPTGAVPSLRPYQCTIDILSDGTYNKLLENYVEMIPVPDYVQPTPGGFGPDSQYFFPRLSNGAVTPTFGVIVGPSGVPTAAPTQPDVQPTTPVIQPQPQPTTPANPPVVVPPSQPGNDQSFLELLLLLIFSFFTFLFGLG